MYKRTAITILLLLFSLVLSAQKAKPKNDSNYDDRILHFGFSMGINGMDYILKDRFPDSINAAVVAVRPGINIQIVTDYRPATYIDIRFLPGVSFGQRNIHFYKAGDIPEKGSLIEAIQIESSYLEFPLSVKGKGMRLNNSRPYLLGGINLRYDLASRKEDNRNGSSSSTEAGSNLYTIRRTDLCYEVGAGIDFYLPYFKLTVEGKMSTGIGNLLRRADPGTPLSNISSLRSQIWVLSFHFE